MAEFGQETRENIFCSNVRTNGKREAFDSVSVKWLLISQQAHGFLTKTTLKVPPGRCFFWIALRLSPGASVMAKFKEPKFGTVFEYHIYEVFKYSINEIRNGFKNLKVGAQSRQTRGRNLNVWNFAAKIDRLDFHAIILMNALRKRGVLLSEKK